MRDQYAGDVSDVIKIALLRALALDDRRLGVAWYYAPGDDMRSDGRHLEWREDPAWNGLDPVLSGGLSALPERSVAALEAAAIWPAGSLFHRIPVPGRPSRAAWAQAKRDALAAADIVFVDPDNGVGRQTSKHATLEEIAALRRRGRAVVFITFPGRTPHNLLVRRRHDELHREAGAGPVLTLLTNVSVPAGPGGGRVVQRQRWFTIVDADETIAGRARGFAEALDHMPRVSAKTFVTHASAPRPQPQPPAQTPKTQSRLVSASQKKRPVSIV